MQRFDPSPLAALLIAMTIFAPVRAQDPAPCECSPSRAQLEANKQLLLDFFAFTGTREERAERFLAEDYIQHNPRLLRVDEITGASGRQSWLQGFREAERRGIRLVDLGGISLRGDPVILMAEGDLVTAIYRGTLPDPDNPARTYEAFAFETVRIRDGQFTEHWDQVTLAPGWLDGTDDSTE
jgi:predicted SnoaL-like aldol condensation-catalyzing enzyme